MHDHSLYGTPQSRSGQHPGEIFGDLAWRGYLTMLAGSAAILGIGYLIFRQMMPGAEPMTGHAAAFEPGETDRHNFDQTRAAGTDAMRDHPGDWDHLDEMADASFPSSDPPSFNPGTA